MGFPILPVRGVDSDSVLIQIRIAEVGIAEAEGRKAGLTIGPPVFAFAQIAVAEEFALVPRAKVVAKRRGLVPAIPNDRSCDEDDSQQEYKGANQKLAIDDRVHCVLLFLGSAEQPKGHSEAGSELRKSVERKGSEGCSTLLKPGVKSAARRGERF